MNASHHRIRRLVFEITLEDQGAAWPLQSELGRIHERSLQTIIDDCCTEASDPGHIHRIESLEVDLGEIGLDTLEHDLIEKLGPSLRDALVARICEADQVAAREGGGPETTSRLELVAFFARTGNLPWWADASKSRLVDETVAFLLQHAARPLATLIRTLAHERRELRRIVLHVDDDRLSMLLDVLVGTSRFDLAEERAVLGALLGAREAIGSEFAQIERRCAVWLAVLRAVCIEEGRGGGSQSFWREVLVHVALELGITYRSLVMGLHERGDPSRRGAPDPLIKIVQSLVHELKAPSSSSTAPSNAPEWSDTSSTSRLESPGFEAATVSDSAARGEHAAASLSAEALAEVRALLHEAIEDATTTNAVTDAPLEVGADAPLTTPAQEHQAILDRIERAGLPPRSLFLALRSLSHHISSLHGAPVLAALRQLDLVLTPPTRSASETPTAILELLRRVIESR